MQGADDDDGTIIVGLRRMDPLFDVPSFAVKHFTRSVGKKQLFRKNICSNDMLMNELLKMRLHYCGEVYVLLPTWHTI